MSGNQYVTYDPDALWTRMEDAHIAAGGDLLYPGSEKEIIFRTVQMALVQMLATADAGIRLATLAGAVGVYLDDYGNKRKCERIEGAAAKCTVEIEFSASGIARHIAAGTAVTADGQRLYLLDEPVEQTGYAQVVTVGITCAETGAAGNGLPAGTQMQFLAGNASVVRMVTTAAASGGRDREDDEAYRARIEAYGLVNSTTGAATQYESAARAVSADIVDVRALNAGAGMVGVYLLLENGADAEAIKAAVLDALTPRSDRPLTDSVTVYEAEALPYVLNVRYTQAAGANIADAVQAAVAEYQKEQDRVLGQPFDANLLLSKLYLAGATRVAWGEGCSFNGSGSIDYTPILEKQHCSGTIEVAVMA